jgi:hypothetical protein
MVQGSPSSHAVLFSLPVPSIAEKLRPGGFSIVEAKFAPDMVDLFAGLWERFLLSLIWPAVEAFCA